MRKIYAYGDEVSSLHLAEALPHSAIGGMAVWTRPWGEINNLTSSVYGISISDDVWTFPTRLFRKASSASSGRPSSRIVSFESLRISESPSDAEAIVRRAKRMAWLYLHAPADTLRSTITLVGIMKRFLSLIGVLANARAFTSMPDDACPDGPFFFRELARETFERLVPATKVMRNGVLLLKDLPREIDDRLLFEVETYSTGWERRAQEKNMAKGKDANAVSLTGIDDLNLSRLLAVCDMYRKYPNLLETIWNWLDVHQKLALQSGKRTGVYRANGDRMLADQVKRTFNEELFQPNWRNWLAAGLITDDRGTLAVPIYSNTQLVYRTVWDLVNRGALKTGGFSIFYSNAVYFALLTAARTQEITALPFDALVPNYNETTTYHQVIGPELKTNDQISGVARDWPLPKAAVSLVTQTQKLHHLRGRILGRSIPKFLFGWHHNITVSFMRMLIGECGYTGPPDNLVRRMRPSSAQLVADVTRSPLAVQKVLGHANLEETLGYCRGRPDDDYRELVEQRKRVRDREIGQQMITEVIGSGATDRMTQGVIKMSLDQIIAHNLGDSIAVERAKDLQTQINKKRPQHFSEIYEMIGEDRWLIDEFIGESVSQPRPFQFCTARKGGVHFSGACSSSDNVINPRNCKSYCPYNFEALASIELRASWIEKELSRPHFDNIEITTEDPIFYNSAMKILDWLWSFEGPLAKFKSDPRLLSIMERVAQDDDLVPLFKGETRRSLQELGVL